MGFQDIVSALANLAPYHLLSYSTLLGMSLWQSFTVVKTVHRVLPRPAFVALQGRLFPIYFQQQTLYLLLTAATIPPYGPISLVHDRISAAMFAVAGVTSFLNLFVYGPRTRQAMLERHGKGIKHTPSNEDVEQADQEEVAALNKAFFKSHMLSLHLNLVTIVTMMAYGWKLALRLKVD